MIDEIELTSLNSDFLHILTIESYELIFISRAILIYII